MKFSSFSEMLELAQTLPKSKLSVAAAGDETVLESVKMAVDKGLIEPILVGNRERIKEAGEKIGFDIRDEWIIHADSLEEAAREAVKKVSSREADLIMKGMIETSIFMKAVLHPEFGLRTGKILSHLGAYDIPGFNRIIFMTDGGINIAPDLEEKAGILQNAIDALISLGIQEPRCAVLSAVELVNPKIPSTLEASTLAKMAQRGQIKGGVVEGPLALDNAINEEAARHKGLDGPVAGKADLLLVPDIEAGNIFGKTIIFCARGTMAGTVLGAAAPIVMTSRADTPYGKLCSIAISALMGKGL